MFRALKSMRRDWRDWSPFVKRGGVAALHDSAVLPGKETNLDLGSLRLVREIISRDPNFEAIETVDTLTVFSKIGS